MKPDRLPIAPFNITDIARKLKSKDWETQQEGEQALEGFAHQGLDVLAFILQTERQKTRRRNRLLSLLPLSGVIGLALVSFIGVEKLGYFYYLLPFLGWFWLLATIGSVYFHGPSRLQHKARLLLTTYEDVRVIGALVDNLGYGNRDIQSRLTRLLPRMKASDTHLLNDRQRARLYRELKPSIFWTGGEERRTFILAILKALEQVGNKTALPYVEELTHHSSSSPIRQAAEECLSYLRAHVQQQEETETLLRASSPALGKEELLRPTAYSVETPPEQMLRPASAEE